MQKGVEKKGEQQREASRCKHLGKKRETDTRKQIGNEKEGERCTVKREELESTMEVF